MKKKIYIAGKITNNQNFLQEFAEAEKTLKAEGYIIMNPAILPQGFTHEQYMEICYAMISVCDGIALLPNWEDSKGAILEKNYAICKGKEIYFYDKASPFFTESGSITEIISGSLIAVNNKTIGQRFIKAVETLLEAIGTVGTMEFIDNAITEDEIETVEQLIDVMEEEIYCMQTN